MSARTEWFPVDVLPVHEGVYQVQNQKHKRVIHAKWAKGTWHLCTLHRDHAAEQSEVSLSMYNGELTHWRGLAADPSKEPA